MVHSLYVLLSLLAGTYILYHKIKSARHRYPPSPPRHWLLGNLADLPRTIDREKLLSWRQNHGDITYLSALGKSLVILNTTDAIKELLDRRAKNYSDRPQTVVAGELMGLDQAIPSYNYTDRYRGLRKVVQQALNPTAVQKYQSIQLEAIKLALESIRKDPVHFKDHCQLAVSRMSIMVTYGIDMKEADSTYMAHFEDLSDTINETLIPGSFLVDLVPVLKYLPKWFPFTYFHEAGARGRKLLNQSADPPFEHVQRCMATGDVPPSFVADLLGDPEGLYKNMKHSPNVLLDVKYAASAMYFAGVETVSLSSFKIQPNESQFTIQVFWYHAHIPNAHVPPPGEAKESSD
ncbi:hypothetical protein QCA50_011637 [Cerrena zonata]|uniref:Cytochrome P450 n=1 Tax=Cerrena zonata TaxID=2478898 RepID=A0AAW0G0Q1_9APHY